MAKFDKQFYIDLKNDFININTANQECIDYEKRTKASLHMEDAKDICVVQSVHFEKLKCVVEKLINKVEELEKRQTEGPEYV